MRTDPAVNRLAAETSPYLLQHAANPVEWYPWGEEALRTAAREGKPILLSVGYSACHWCHVMAHESFEDPETAALMNRLFVNVKVDREERPDIDRIYQSAQHLLTRRSGGWPLTMFLDHEDRIPFFGGTYFPPSARFGLPSFQDILRRVSHFYAERRGELREQSQALVAALASLEPAADGDEIVTPRPLDEARTLLARSFDAEHGGFGGAPKFPHPTNIEGLMRRFAASAQTPQRDDLALSMATQTLRRMCLGGIYDQLGGGFCRYSVDERWMIPHFEKMLYDNGPLLALCAQAWQVTGERLFRQVAQETGEWAIREMQSPEGGYYSSLDADSEGEEGRFYVWEPEEVRALLREEDWPVFAARFGLERPPNFEGRHWHLHVQTGLEALARRFDTSGPEIEAALARSRGTLLAVRSARVWPGRDDKVLTSWNALMIKGMAVAGGVLSEPRFLRSAEAALDFLREHLWRKGRLRATWKEGRARFAAYLDDHAFLIDAILALLQERWNGERLAFAVDLADVLLEHFEDSDTGGFFFTADDHEALIHRSKPFADDALPAGNGIAAHALGRLGHLLGERRYLDAAERAVRAAWKAIQRVPHAHTAMLLATEEFIYPPQTTVLRGSPEALASWAARCRRHYAPRRAVFAIPDAVAELPGILAERRSAAGPVAYVCHGHHCDAPITDLGALDEAMREGEVGEVGDVGEVGEVGTG